MRVVGAVDSDGDTLALLMRNVGNDGDGVVGMRDEATTEAPTLTSSLST